LLKIITTTKIKMEINNSELDLVELTILILSKCPVVPSIILHGNPSVTVSKTLITSPEWLNVLVLDKGVPEDAPTDKMFSNVHVLLKLLVPLASLLRP